MVDLSGIKKKNNGVTFRDGIGIVIVIVGAVIVVIMVKVIKVIFVSGMRFLCHYNNIIKNYIYIVSRKESAKSFLTLMTNDLNDTLVLVDG